MALTVTDDGRGGAIGPTAVGHGVRTMGQRAQRLDGRFEIGPAEAGFGTTVRWSAPLG